jgi:hypothetical protein
MADEKKEPKLVTVCMAWSGLIDSMKVSVRALRDGGGFVKILEKHGLTMVDSAGLSFVFASGMTINPAAVTEISPEVAEGKQKLIEGLAKAGIECNPTDIKLRVFPTK